MINTYSVLKLEKIGRMKCISRKPLGLFHRIGKLPKNGERKMQKTKRLALLSFLLVLSVGSAFAAQASGALQSWTDYQIGEDAIPLEINLQTASVTLALTSEDRAKVKDMVLADSQIQQLLEGADSYTIQVSDVFDVIELDFDVQDIGEGIALVPKKGLAEATIEISNDYGDEFGVQVITVTVDLENDEITDIDVEPEVRRPKVIEDVLSISELVQNPLQYNGTVVTVSGEVSMLGMVWSYTFRLDDTVTVFYRHQDADVDVSSIQNGDIVTVTGIFVSPSTIYAQQIEKP